MVFDPQISTKVDELKDKVEETKSDMDRLTLMSNVLEKQRKQEEIESLLSRIESDLYGLETTLTQQESIETDPQVIDLIHIEKEKIKEIRITFLGIQGELDSLAVAVTQSSPQPPENTAEPGFFEKAWDGVTEQWDKLPDGVKTGAKVAGGIVTGVLIWKGVKKLFGWGDDKEKEESSSDDSTPRYKKWYTRVAGGVLGILGIKYGKEFMARFESLFGGDQNKRDKAFETIANNLGTDYEYDNVTGKFDYKNGRKYSIKELHEKGLIKTTVDKNGDMVIDIASTQAAIKEHMENDTETQSNNLDDVDFTKEKWENLSPSARLEYGSIDRTIEKFTQDTQSIDSDIFQTKGMMVYHLDENYNNIDHLLGEKTFDNFMETTTTDMAEKLLKHMPGIFISAIQGSAELSKSLGLHDVASGSGNFAEKLRDLQPEFEPALRKIAISFYEQWTDVSIYVLSVRNAYEESVDGDESAMERFGKYSLIDLYKESEAAKKDKYLQKALEKPLLDEDVTGRVESLVRKEKGLLSDLEKEPTRNEVHEVLETLVDDIDYVGYNTWAGAFSMIWGHLRETDRYLEYDILEQQYEEYMGGTRKKLQGLLSKDSYSSGDIDDIKNHVSDFYETMRKITTDVELRQETDEDGDIYTRWKIPVIRAGKTMYQTFMISLEEGDWMLMGGVLASADLFTAIPRKLAGGMVGGAISASGVPFVGKGVRKLVGFSPTWKLAKLAGGKGLQGLGRLAGVATKGPMRGINRWINKYPWLAYSRFDSADDFVSALEKGRIRLSDAAELLAKKSVGNKLGKDFANTRFIGGLFESRGKEWRQLGFGNDILQNKKILLRSMKRLKELIPDMNSKDWDLLAKYRDDPKWSKNLRSHTMTGTKFETLMKGLREFDLSGRVPSGVIDAGVDVLGKGSVEDMTKTIAKSKKSVESYTKKIFKEFDEEVAKYAQTKGIKKGTKAYEEASRFLWNSENYGLNPKLQSLITEHNDLSRVLEVDILKKFNLADRNTKQKMVADNPFLDAIIKKNGGLDKRKIPKFGKAGRIISVGVHAVMLGWIGSGDNALGHEKSTGEVATDVADFGLGMIPVAGGVYDIGMAFRGVDLNGREMETWERWTRGGVGLVTGVLDVFTLGLGGTAIRAAVKGGTKLAVKAGTKKVATESIEIASKGFAKKVIKKTLVSAGRDILIGSAAGVALIPVFDHFEETKIYDEK